jgi:hypothetical protein
MAAGGHGPALLATGVLPVARAGAVTGSRVADDRACCPAADAACGTGAWRARRRAGPGGGMIVACCP